MRCAYVARKLSVVLGDIEEKRAWIDVGRQADGRVQIEIAGDGARHVLLAIENHWVSFERADL